MDEKQWPFSATTIRNSSRKISIIFKTSTTVTTSAASITTPFTSSNGTTTVDDIFDDANGEFLSSLSLLALIILYGIVVFGGVFGNSTLLISLCSQSPSRVRNPLLLALCAADLLVTLISAPITIVGVILKQSRTMSFSLANFGCKAFHYMQVN